MEIDEEGFGWGEFLHVRIHVNLMKPLARGKLLQLKDRTTWVDFKYERITHFYFRCGVICHGPSGCPLGKLSSKPREENKI